MHKLRNIPIDYFGRKNYSIIYIQMSTMNFHKLRRNSIPKEFVSNKTVEVYTLLFEFTNDVILKQLQNNENI